METGTLILKKPVITPKFCVVFPSDIMLNYLISDNDKKRLMIQHPSMENVYTFTTMSNVKVKIIKTK